MTRRVKHTLLGVLIGLVGDLLGFFVYTLVFVMLNNVSYRFFIEEVFLGTDLFKSQIFTGSILLNVVLFYIFMRKDLNDLNRGLIIVILFTVMAIVFYI